MTRQAQVGAFAIVALLLLFGIFYVITDFGTRHTGYRVGVHFQSAAGVTPGALVYFSGVNVGSVDSIELLPDNTVDVILAINRDIDIPAASRFLIQAPLTGIALGRHRAARAKAAASAAAAPSLADRGAASRLEHRVHRRPADAGTGRAQALRQRDGAARGAHAQAPRHAADDARQCQRSDGVDEGRLQQLSGEFLALGANLNRSLAAASANVEQLSATLNSAATTDSRKLGALLDQFNPRRWRSTAR